MASQRRAGNHLTIGALGEGQVHAKARPGPRSPRRGDPDWGRSLRPATPPDPGRETPQVIPGSPEEGKEPTTHLPGTPRRCRTLLGPLVAPTLAAALGAALKGLKGRAAPPLAAPGLAAPPAGTWSPRSPGLGARALPKTTTPEPPRPCHGGNVGGVPTSEDLGAEGCGVKTALKPRCLEVWFNRFLRGKRQQLGTSGQPAFQLYLGLSPCTWLEERLSAAAHILQPAPANGESSRKLSQLGAPCLPLARAAAGPEKQTQSLGCFLRNPSAWDLAYGSCGSANSGGGLLSLDTFCFPACKYTAYWPEIVPKTCFPTDQHVFEIRRQRPEDIHTCRCQCRVGKD